MEIDISFNEALKGITGIMEKLKKSLFEPHNFSRNTSPLKNIICSAANLDKTQTRNTSLDNSQIDFSCNYFKSATVSRRPSNKTLKRIPRDKLDRSVDLVTKIASRYAANNRSFDRPPSVYFGNINLYKTDIQLDSKRN